MVDSRDGKGHGKGRKCPFYRGGDLGRTGGRSPPKFEVGDGPCIGPPNILRSSVVGWARKLEESKK